MLPPLYLIICFKIRYHCTAGKCEQYGVFESKFSPYTLIMRRSTQTARAADPFSGSERYIIELMLDFMMIHYIVFICYLNYVI